MIVAEVQDKRLKLVDKLRENVRLAAGLRDDKTLSDEVIARAIVCLERFGQRLRDISSENVRIVGTNTLRKARNSDVFIQQAEKALGHGIDIITGHEEARLIYLGVSHSLEDNGDRRLVVDIGGGSTELILGQHFKPQYMESLHMGCVAMSQRYFGDGMIVERRLEAAEIAALQELESINYYRRISWDSAVGASGTILAVRDVVQANGWSNDGITADSLRKLRREIIAAREVDKLQLAGLQPERAPVFPGGFAVLSGVFRSLNIEHMRVSDGALREGALYDLLGRIHHGDVREQTVNDLASRYNVNQEQSRRVCTTAVFLLEQTRDKWQLDNAEYKQALTWAANLHQIGMAISHSQYHKHGGYLLRNLDMPGFARSEQRLLAAIVRGHRRKFPLAEFKELPKQLSNVGKRLCILLRLSVVLHRSHSEMELSGVTVEVNDRSMTLTFADDWLQNQPLTRADLEQEADYLKAVDFKLRFS